MARLIITNPLLTGLSGRIGDLCIRQTKNGPIISKLPDRSNFKPNGEQKKQMANFSRAVEFAKAVIRDPVQRQEWELKLKKGQSVYHAALTDYLRNHKK